MERTIPPRAAPGPEHLATTRVSGALPEHVAVLRYCRPRCAERLVQAVRGGDDCRECGGTHSTGQVRVCRGRALHMPAAGAFGLSDRSGEQWQRSRCACHDRATARAPVRGARRQLLLRRLCDDARQPSANHLGAPPGAPRMRARCPRGSTHSRACCELAVGLRSAAATDRESALSIVPLVMTITRNHM